MDFQILWFSVIVTTILYFTKKVDCHAIFWEPPSRASLGKHNMNFCKVPVNNDHMSLYCGGIDAQHQIYDGKCGVCGDPYGKSEHKPHQYPGKFATGNVTRLNN